MNMDLVQVKVLYNVDLAPEQAEEAEVEVVVDQRKSKKLKQNKSRKLHLKTNTGPVQAKVLELASVKALDNADSAPGSVVELEEAVAADP